jgi:uncharacterized protein YjiS (DUF1127 family)
MTTLPLLNRSHQSTHTGADLSSPSAWFSAWLSAYRLRRARRLTEQALQRLDIRELKDLGLTTTEIRSVIHGAPHERLQHYDPNWNARAPL